MPEGFSNPHPRSRQHIELAISLGRVNLFLGILCAAVLTTSFFSIPFPLVRALWIKEIWGITGFIHAMILVWIMREIGRAKLPAPLAGLGLVISDQLLLWHGFIHLLHIGAVSNAAVFFLVTSIFLSSLVAAVLIYAFRKIYFYRTTHHHHADAAEAAADEEGSYAALLFSLVGYGVCFLFIAVSSRYADEFFKYAFYKIFSSVICVGAMAGIGFEMKLLAEKKQSSKMTWTKVLSHCLALASVLWVIHRLLPVGAVIQPV